MVAVKARELGRLARLIRHRARLRQVDVARAAGVGRWKVIDLEAGRLADLSFGEVEACLDCLDMGLVVRAVYRGAEADRLLDQRHADLVEAITTLLRTYGWEVRVEVSFAFYGERGSIDVVGWHAPSLTLLIVEVKSEAVAPSRRQRGVEFSWRETIRTSVVPRSEAGISATRSTSSTRAASSSSEASPVTSSETSIGVEG
jgi:hypothetical protein